MRQRQVIAGVVLFAGAVALAIWALWSPEPAYQGRSLSAWLWDLESNRSEVRAQAVDAVQHIGTNALPFLVERLLQDPRRRSRLDILKNKLERLASRQSFINISFRHSQFPRFQAEAALDALGPMAAGPLPALEKLLQENPPDPYALYLAARMGEAGVPLISRCLTNDVRVLRLEAPICLDLVRSNTLSDLYPGATGHGVGDFMWRSCLFNTKLLAAAFKDYAVQRREHPQSDDFPFPDDALPDSSKSQVQIKNTPDK